MARLGRGIDEGDRVRLRAVTMAVGASIAMAIGSVAAGAAAPAAPLRTVRYHGVTVRVPRSWPVVDLTRHPSTCVRFDRHALYLGRPGVREACPANGIGRSEAILITPTSGVSAGAVRSGLAPGYSTTLVIPSAGVRITATWSTAPGVVSRALGRALRVTPLAATARRATARQAHDAAAVVSAIRNAGLTSPSAFGFDTCSAPSLAVMNGWLASPFRTVGVYIGGVNSACAQPNLTAAWVQAVTAAGWRLIPTYVGLQAVGACTGCAAITASRAHLQGVQAANDAVVRARTLGIPPGNPVYFDMEGYSRSTSTSTAVVAFLSGWTAQLHIAGYTSGVYAGGGSGIIDLVNARGSAIVEPDELWIAHWDGAASTSDASVPAGMWANHQRLKQYLGGHNVRYAGTTLDIDSDYIDGATASGQGFPPPDGSFVSYGGRTFRMVGGAPLQVVSWSAVGGVQGALALTQTQWRALRRLPRDGTVVTTRADGRMYEIVGGAPVALTSPAAIGATRTAVAIDPWDLANITNPMAHLRATPADGTFVASGPAGPVFRIVGDAPFAIVSWTAFGGPRPAVTIDPWNLLHPANPRARLRARPQTGTLVTAIRARSTWRFAGGYRVKVPPVPGAIQVDDTGLAAYPARPVCVVPALAGMTVAQARSALALGHCALGVVSRRGTAWRRRTPHVVAQGFPAAARKRLGQPVGITIA